MCGCQIEFLSEWRSLHWKVRIASHFCPGYSALNFTFSFAHSDFVSTFFFHEVIFLQLHCFLLSLSCDIIWWASSYSRGDWIQASWLHVVKVCRLEIDRPCAYCVWPCSTDESSCAHIMHSGKVWFLSVVTAGFFLVWLDFIIPQPTGDEMRSPFGFVLLFGKKACDI